MQITQMGYFGFLEAGLGCGEVWLPGRWLTVLPHALDPSLEVFESLLRQAQEVGAVIEELSRQRELLPERRPLIEIYGNYLAQERFLVEQRNREPEPQNAGGLSVSGWPEELVDDLEKAAQLNDEVRPFWPPAPWRRWERYWWEIEHLPPIAASLTAGAIDAADRIRKISLAAFHAGISVRWFEYDTVNPAGGTHWIRPLNAKAVAYVPRAPRNWLLRFLALTTANRESLVFWTPVPSGSGVLFTADSDLKAIRLPLLVGAIVTAPHHGSEANSAAYAAVRTAAGSATATITWIRSDGRFKARPGPSYMASPGRRICTLCRTTTRPTPK